MYVVDLLIEPGFGVQVGILRACVAPITTYGTPTTLI